MSKYLHLCLIILAMLAPSCERSPYQQLAAYQERLEPLDAELQGLLDEYQGARLRVPAGYGSRLPLSPAEADFYLTRVRETADKLAALEVPDVAAEIAELKKAAAEALIDAAGKLAALVGEWEGAVPIIGADNSDITDELSLDEQRRYQSDQEAVDAAFEDAQSLLEVSALELARAVLAARGEE